MKILFIYPNAGSQLGFSYGIAHLSAILRRAGHKVALWQLCEDIAPLPSEKNFSDRLRQENPDIIGFSVVTNQWSYAKKLAVWAREATDAPLVCGGIHVMAATEQVLRSGVFDYIMRGEAEDALAEFVDKLSRGHDITGIANLGFMQNGEPRLNPLNHQFVSHYRKDLACSFKGLNYIRHFPVEQMMKEIKYLLAHYRNIRMFILDDDLFTFYRRYVRQFCESYRKISPLPFVVNGHVGFFDKIRARWLADANCARQFGLHSSVFLMIGLPGETHDDLMATIELMARAQPGRYRWSFFFPFPGTKAYDIARDGDYIDFEKMGRLENFTDASCLRFGPEQDLLLKKVGRIMPWFVNARSDFETADFYRRKVEEILALDEADWQRRAQTIEQEDKDISKEFVRRGLRHYALKYNRFMGVVSDYFTNEDRIPAHGAAAIDSCRDRC
ncbi:MAG: hypothetical protein B6I22_14995 [Desulfobacteraceae bacterium 4572_123]|nr:MAG: hypothetical protein B6I22_14995 [Desulfobacteraceae bacterium 4572_123]